MENRERPSDAQGGNDRLAPWCSRASTTCRESRLPGHASSWGRDLRRAVHLFRASGQIGKLKLQGREVGGFFGWRCPGSHQLRFLVAGGQSVNQQDSGAGFGMGLWPARFHWLAILGFWKRQLSRVCGAGESAKRNGRACAGRSIRVRGDKSSTKAGDWQLKLFSVGAGVAWRGYNPPFRRSASVIVGGVGSRLFINE